MLRIKESVVIVNFSVQRYAKEFLCAEISMRVANDYVHTEMLLIDANEFPHTEMSLMDANYTMDEHLATRELSLHPLPMGKRYTTTIQFNEVIEIPKTVPYSSLNILPPTTLVRLASHFSQDTSLNFFLLGFTSQHPTPV